MKKSMVTFFPPDTFAVPMVAFVLLGRRIEPTASHVKNANRDCRFRCSHQNEKKRNVETTIFSRDSYIRTEGFTILLKLERDPGVRAGVPFQFMVFMRTNAYNFNK